MFAFTEYVNALISVEVSNKLLRICLEFTEDVMKVMKSWGTFL